MCVKGEVTGELSVPSANFSYKPNIALKKNLSSFVKGEERNEPEPSTWRVRGRHAWRKTQQSTKAWSEEVLGVFQVLQGN